MATSATSGAVTPVHVDDASSPLDFSIVIPCLNEARTLGACIREGASVARALGIAGEVVVADNGSTDGSQEIAEHHGARASR